MGTDMLPYVFISYVSENLRRVRRISKDLSREGIEVWLDRDQKNPGLRWKDARETDFYKRI